LRSPLSSLQPGLAAMLRPASKPLMTKPKARFIAAPQGRSKGRSVGLDLTMGGPDDKDAQFKAHS
jgi:hypothetical protein